MTAQTPGDPVLDARELMVQGLGGAKFVAEFYSKRRAQEAVAKLMMCHGHHFAVVGEGHHVVMSGLAVECLRRAGLIPASESWVYEQGRE